MGLEIFQNKHELHEDVKRALLSDFSAHVAEELRIAKLIDEVDNLGQFRKDCLKDYLEKLEKFFNNQLK